MAAALDEQPEPLQEPKTSSLLTPEERRQLLQLARQALEDGVCSRPLLPLALETYSPRLRQDGASFVTLMIEGQLRGCVGALEAYQPLVEDVREHAIAAAINDFRFIPIQPDELALIKIEVSCLTQPQPLLYEHSDELLARLRPGIDGVVLRDGMRRATFLPQVWEKIPEPIKFLNHLCQKLGVYPDTWRRKKLEVFTYQVEEFHE